jgi:hypothetical protein
VQYGEPITLRRRERPDRAEQSAAAGQIFDRVREMYAALSS